MIAKLSSVSPGVIHSTACRTRLRIAKHHCSSYKAKLIKDAIEMVPGVVAVRIIESTGSIVIEHDKAPSIIAQIGEAIAQITPDIFDTLTAAPTESSDLPFANGFISGFLDPANLSAVRRAMPLALLSIGVYQLVRQGSLIAGIAPFVFFYQAYDQYLKSRDTAMNAAEKEKMMLK